MVRAEVVAVTEEVRGELSALCDWSVGRCRYSCWRSLSLQLLASARWRELWFIYVVAVWPYSKCSGILVWVAFVVTSSHSCWQSQHSHPRQARRGGTSSIFRLTQRLSFKFWNVTWAPDMSGIGNAPMTKSDRTSTVGVDDKLYS